jgi:hypothetical protein
MIRRKRNKTISLSEVEMRKYHHQSLIKLVELSVIVGYDAKQQHRHT